MNVSQNMRKLVYRLVLAVVVLFLLPVVLLTISLGQEGYPTLAASRNYVFRDGQIQVKLPEGCEITEMRYGDDAVDSITVEGNTGVIRVGYTMADLAIFYEHEGKSRRITMGEVRKMNNWNRLRFLGYWGDDNEISFRIKENGVSRDEGRYLINHDS